MPPKVSPEPVANVPFSYSPLPDMSKSIRLIKIHTEIGRIITDEPGPPIDEIVCTIAAFDLETAPPFDALSYTWGNPYGAFRDEMHEISANSVYNKMNPIICNRRVLEIGMNLFGAVKLLFAGQRAGGDLSQIQPGLSLSEYIWIDAICIDQSNFDERNHQVKLMAHIYQKAEKTIIWLGEEDSSVADAVKVIGTIGKAALFLDKNWNEIGDIFASSKRLDERDFSRYGVPAFTTSEWHSVLAFYSRTWFRRMWILQEVVLSQDSIVFCGFSYFQWSFISMTAAFLCRSTWAADLIMEGERYYRFEKSRTLFSTPISISEVRCELGLKSSLISIKGAKSPSLLSLLHRFRTSKSKEAKDKIYAASGLVKGSEILAVLNRITFDYRVPDQQVYLETALAILSSIKNLDLLSLSGRRGIEGVPNLPSWVPDWSVPEPSQVLRDEYLEDESCNEVPWDACAGLSWKYPDLQTLTQTLSVQGKCVGKITNVLEAFNNFQDIKTIRYSLNQLSRIYLTPHDSSTSSATISRPDGHIPLPFSTEIRQTRFEAVWRTLILDCWEGKHPAPEEAGHAFAKALLYRHIMMPLGSHDLMTAMGMRAENWEILKELSNDEKECIEIYNLTKSVHHGTEIHQAENNESKEIEPTKYLPNLEGSMISGNWNKEFSDSLFENIQKDFSNCRRSLRAKPMFITDTGLLGLGFGASKVEDEVWILAGAKVPFIFRKATSGTYQLVGEAYVHGIMHGEAVTGLGLEDLQDIVLI